ncbi:MAG: DUF1730 domain-containing protein, partial [Gammaproteobacteria bacterium]|nr:DUF1730 domain-containing protein [Gammaproteobacteria bacterium]
MEITSEALKLLIRKKSTALGFDDFGVSHCDLEPHEHHLQQWSRAGYHGEMEYMVRHGTKRSRPQELLPGTRCLLSFRMNYLPAAAADSEKILQQDEKGFISRYALGRDYHKVMRSRLAQLYRQIEETIGPFGYRLFVDSAPVLE